MAAAKSARSPQAVNGLLLLNKPAGITSNRALQRVKRLLRVKKAGHAGSLDPAATGMLPLCFGEATKVCAFLLDADKSYRVTMRLGAATDTGDADGAIVERAELPSFGRDEWARLLEGFVGVIEQVPPMYSALKKDGKRLYELARRGQVVDREPRQVTIHEIVLLELHGPRLVFRVRCSKGTYVRTLVEDIARAAGTVAHTMCLHREQVGDFRSEDMLDLAHAEKLGETGPAGLGGALLPVDRALANLDAVVLPAPDEARFLHGQAAASAPGTQGLVRVYGPGERFLGVAERDADGRLKPRRVFHLEE